MFKMTDVDLSPQPLGILARKRLSTKEVLASYQNRGLPNNFCPVPFSTLIFEADGKVCPCRKLGSGFSIGEITKNSIEEIWNGESLQLLRKEFLSGNVITCAKNIARNLCHLDYQDAELFPWIELSARQTQLPLKISPNINGACNLRCQTCHKWRFPNGLYDKLGFWAKLETDLLPRLREIDHFSGEPFVQKDTYRLIELAARVNPQILWSFTTNGFWRLNDRIKSYLDQIQIKSFAFSIDSLDPERFAKIRKGGNIERVLSTLNLVKQYELQRIESGRGPMNLTVNFVLQKDNADEIPRIFQFRRKNKTLIRIICLEEPEEFSVLALSEKQRMALLDYYLREMPPEDLVGASRVFRNLIEGLTPLARATILTRYKEKIARAARAAG